VTELLTTTHEAARRLGIGRTKLFELLKEDRLRAVRLGSKTLIPVAELENFAATLPLRNGKSTTKPPLLPYPTERAVTRAWPPLASLKRGKNYECATKASSPSAADDTQAASAHRKGELPSLHGDRGQTGGEDLG
jgi:excisionase family DNA binding protein